MLYSLLSILFAQLANRDYRKMSAALPCVFSNLCW